MIKAFLDKYGISILGGVFLLASLWLTSLHSYLLFHSLVEAITVGVAWAVFFLAWNSRRFLDNDYLLFVGIASLFVGAIDLLHTLAFKGMGVFAGTDANLATQLWIAGRYLQSTSLLLAPLFLRRKLNARAAFVGYGAVVSLLLAAIFLWRVFPDAYIEGHGLTAFKIDSEYVVILIFLAALGWLWVKRKEFDPGVLRHLTAAIGFTMVAELVFTLYISVYDLSNMTGHLIRLVGVYFLYRAIIVTGLVKPYDLLFRNLRQHEGELEKSKAQLQAANAQLKTEIVERTTEAQARERAEQALRVSEARVRRKLESVLSPEGDIAALELADIIDAPAIQALVNDFYTLAHIPMSVIDLQGNVLVGVGWQDICTQFHRIHPVTCKHCIESDLHLSVGVAPGEFRLYKCKNNMWDVATPIMIGDRQVGNVFSGQFFFDDEPVERQVFINQAKTYGFDEPAYLAALDRVPRLTRDEVNTGMAFLTKLAGLISKLSYSNLKLARTLEERQALTRSLQQNQETLRTLNQNLEQQAEELKVANAQLEEQAEELQVANVNLEEALTEVQERKRVLEEADREIQRLNQGLEQRAAELQAANKELEAFSYSISHDLRTPLASIENFAHLLIEEHASELSEEGQTFLRLVRDHAQEMDKLVKSLLEFSRLSRRPLRKQLVQPAELVQAVLGDLRVQRDSRTGESNRDVQIQVGDLPQCNADPILLKQVFANLLSNAVKYTRERDHTCIEVGHQINENAESVYFVRDNGVGFDMAEAGKLFGVFQRLHSEEEYEGTGVGLAIVQRIIHRHGGRVWAEGEVDKGATFYFTLDPCESKL